MPALTTENTKPLPADDAFNVTAAAVSFMNTSPVELAAKVEALMVLRAVKLIPPVPAVREALAAFRAPAATIPLAAPLPFRVNDVPELAFNVIGALLVSIIETGPVEPIVRVEALVEPVPLMVTPPVPEETTRVGVVTPLVEDTEPAPPGVAVKEIELAAVNAAVNVTLPAVEFNDKLLAVMVEPIDALLMVLAAVTFT